jgi:hypothetical protein
LPSHGLAATFQRGCCATPKYMRRCAPIKPKPNLL